MRPNTRAAGLVCLAATLLLSAALCANAQPSYAKNKHATYPSRRAGGGGSYSRDNPSRHGAYGGAYGGGDYHSSDPYSGYHHKRTKLTGTKPAALAGDLDLDVSVCSIGLPGVTGTTSSVTSNVAIWFKLDCEEAPVPPVDDDDDYGYGYGSYDRGYDRGYDRDYDRGYGNSGGYKHHTKNHTKRHDPYEDYGNYRRRLQATLVQDIGECLLTGISPVGITYDQTAKATYSAQVSGKCTLTNKAKRCHSQFGGINALGAGASFTLLGDVKLEYVPVYVSPNAPPADPDSNKFNAASDLKLDITSFYNGPAQLGSTALNSLPLTRFNVGQATLTLTDCKSNNLVGGGEGTLEESTQGDGTLALEWSI